MIGYLFVAAALAAGLTKGYCGKKTSGVISGTRATMLFNGIRMLLCIPVGFLFVLNAGALSSLAPDPLTLLISAVSGASTALFVVTWIGCVRWGAYMMVDVFVTLGIVIPMVLCSLLFNEEILAVHLLGLVMLVFAAYMMCTYNNALSADRPRLGKKQYLLLLLCGASNGVTQFSQKWLRYAVTTDITVFQFYTYVIAAVVLLGCAMLVRETDKAKKQPLTKKEFLRLGAYVCIMAVCLFLHSYFSTAAAGYLPSSQLYPLMQGSSLILSMLMSAVCFGERITVRCLIGIAAAFGALVCINLF